MALETRERGADRAEIGRVVADHLEKFGAVQMRAVSGPLPGDRITSPIHLPELAADPAAPAVNTALLYSKDNGAGKTQVCIRFNTGAVQIIATEP